MGFTNPAFALRFLPPYQANISRWTQALTPKEQFQLPSTTGYKTALPGCMPISEKVRRSTYPWGNSRLLLTAGVGSLPPHSLPVKTGIPAGRLCFDMCVTLRCWACTEPSKRRGENEATSLSSVRHYKESSQSFWAWFSQDHIYIHVYTHAYMHFFLSFFFQVLSLSLS